MIENESAERSLGETLSDLFVKESDLGPPTGWVLAPWLGEDCYVNPNGPGVYGTAEALRRLRERGVSASEDAESCSVPGLTEAELERRMEFAQARGARMRERMRAWERETGIRCL